MSLQNKAAFYLARKSISEKTNLIDQETIDKYSDENITFDVLIELGLATRADPEAEE